MRKMIAVLTLAALVSSAACAANKLDDKKSDEDKKKEATQLKVGDAAPPLKATKWLIGKEVEGFAPGKVYVVEFWATWCGPCIVMMPHLGELQSEYKDKGLTVIGYTSKDPNNTAEKVAEFVSKRGPKLGYTFAYGDDQKTYQAWMTAADQHGIPCSFVVDQHGKLAYIGHPMFLGEVLPKVIAGTWKAEQGAAEVAELEKDVNDMFAKLQNSDASAALKDLAEFQTRRPGLAKIPFFEGPKISLLIKNKQFDEAKKAIDSILEKAIARDDAGALATIARSLQGPEVKENKEFAERLLKAADAMLKISGDKDLGALLTVADAYFSLGDKAKARTYAKRAVDAAPDDIRSKVETYVKKYDEKKDDTKKEVKE